MYKDPRKHDVKIVPGDLNAIIVQERVYRPRIDMRSYMYANTISKNGSRVIDFAAARHMVVVTTTFAHRKIHDENWIFPN